MYTQSYNIRPKQQYQSHFLSTFLFSKHRNIIYSIYNNIPIYSNDITVITDFFCVQMFHFFNFLFPSLCLTLALNKTVDLKFYCSTNSNSSYRRRRRQNALLLTTKIHVLVNDQFLSALITRRYHKRRDYSLSHSQ